MAGKRARPSFFLVNLLLILVERHAEPGIRGKRVQQLSKVWESKAQLRFGVRKIRRPHALFGMLEKLLPNVLCSALSPRPWALHSNAALQQKRVGRVEVHSGKMKRNGQPKQQEQKYGAAANGKAHLRSPPA